MDRPPPLDVAKALVADRYPDAVQAWLSGSAIARATATSDLDVVVLCRHGSAHRESLIHQSWAVELFVHTDVSLRKFVAADVARRRPTLARMVATGVPLGDRHAAVELQQECAAVVAAGPGRPSDEELESARYLLTDLLDDLAAEPSGPELSAVAVAIWQRTAELRLDAAGWWRGSGKWLVREVEALDADQGTHFAGALHTGLGAALAGNPSALIRVADEALQLAGGRLWEGFRTAAPAAAESG